MGANPHISAPETHQGSKGPTWVAQVGLGSWPRWPLDQQGF